MAEYLTTKEIARYLRLNEKKVYTLVAQGKLPAARVSGKWLFPKHLVDQWVERNTVFPSSGLLGALLDQLLVLQGSDDWLFSQVIEKFMHSPDGCPVVSSKVGSVAGLTAVGRGQAHLAGCHVGDDVVRASTGDRGCYVLHLFDRQQGLIYDGQRHGGITGLASVAQLGLRFAGRQPLSGTHLLVQRCFAELGIDTERVEQVGPFSSHLDLALAIRAGRADAGVGIQVAAELCGLDFIPLAREPFRLVIPTGFAAHPRVARFLEYTLDRLRLASRERTPGYCFDQSCRLEALGGQTTDRRADHADHVEKT